MGICKLVIKAYDDNGYSSEKGEFVTTINPTNLKISNKIDYVDSQMMGNPTWMLQYNKSQPRILSFSLLFDNTGIFPNSNIDVKQQVKNLEWLIFSNQKDINEPYFIRVIWGNIDFKGKLLKLETSFSMFKNDGSPIRAQADIEIIEHHSEEINGESQKEIEEKEKKEEKNEEKEEKDKTTNEQAKNQSNDENAQENNDTNTEAKKEVEEAQKEEESKNDDKKEEKKEEGKEEKEEGGKEEKKDEENINDQKEEKNNEGEAENEEEYNKKEEGKEKDNTNVENEKIGGNDEITNSNIVKAGDTLPSVVKNNLGGLPKVGSLLSKIAKFNLLNTLRNLIAGAALLIPLTIAALIALLFKKLISLIKRGVTFIRNKTKKAINKAREGGNKIAKKVKNGADKTKNIGKNGFQKMKNGAKNIKNEVKKGYQKAKNSIK